MILSYLSAQPMERARVGCILNIESVYSWEDNELDIRGKEGEKHKTVHTPAGSHIWFGNYASGLAHRFPRAA